MSRLLVVAGEASGDRAAASVVAALRRNNSRLHVFGMGGDALAREGVELVHHLRDTTALGVVEVARRAARLGVAWGRLRLAIQRSLPAAALLVNYTEFNGRLARALWPAGTRVLWYGAPQIWAWRADRAPSLRRAIDRMAVMLPFEEQLWRTLGVDARYVGHPALEDRVPPEAGEARRKARELLGLTARADAIAILPGSRPHEVRRLLLPMLSGYEAVRREIASMDARLLLAPSLDERTLAWAKAAAAAHAVEVVEVDARAGLASLLPAFDVALCASGTASLECALARVVPVVCYRVSLATEAIARALVSVDHVALPNVLLGRAAFPELLQREATATRIGEVLGKVLEQRASFAASCAEVEARLEGRAHASREVAAMLAPWLRRGALERRREEARPP